MGSKHSRPTQVHELEAVCAAGLKSREIENVPVEKLDSGYSWLASDEEDAKSARQKCLEGGVLHLLCCQLGKVFGLPALNASYFQRSSSSSTVAAVKDFNNTMKPSKRRSGRRVSCKRGRSSGIGFGDACVFNADETTKRRDQFCHAVNSLLKYIALFADMEDRASIVEVLSNSSFVPCIIACLKNVDVDNLGSTPTASLLHLLQKLSQHDDTMTMMQSVPSESNCIASQLAALEKLFRFSCSIDADGATVESETVDESKASDSTSVTTWLELCVTVVSSSDNETKSETVDDENDDESKDASPLSAKNTKQAAALYEEVLSSYTVMAAPASEFESFTIPCGADSGQRKNLKEVRKEIRLLRQCLSVSFGSSIFVRYNKVRPYMMRAVITGPEGTPYDSGVFAFDILLPPSYPANPPLMKIITTDHGRVRFNPNLYACGQVCLSLLGTWSGEPWRAGQSTLFQVLVSIQALILVDEPYYNEPGRSSANAATLRTANNGGWEYLRLQSIKVAMTEQMLNTTPGFSDIVRRHFQLKRHYLQKTLLPKYVKDANKLSTPDFKQQMKDAVTSLEIALVNTCAIPDSVNTTPSTSVVGDDEVSSRDDGHSSSAAPSQSTSPVVTEGAINASQVPVLAAKTNTVTTSPCNVDLEVAP